MQPSWDWTPFSYGDVHKMQDGEFVLTRAGDPIVIGWGPSNEDGDEAYPCPFGRPGDTLWVREAWRTLPSLDRHNGVQIAQTCISAGQHQPWAPVQYEADGTWSYAVPMPMVPGRYRHARFMPRWASRFLLEITDIRVERLQDISKDDAIAEGIECAEDFFGCPCWKSYSKEDVAADVVFPDDPIGSYKSLLSLIHGPELWDANPWSWVIFFRELCRKNEC